MKYIRWIVAVAVVGSTGVAIIVQDADAGDAVVNLQSPEIVLTVAERQAYAAWVLDVWPDSVPAQISGLQCCRDRLCTILWRPPTMSASAYNTEEDAGRVYRRPTPEQIAADDSEVYHVELYERRRLDWNEETQEPDPSQGEAAALAAINETVFGIATSVQQCIHIWTVYDEDISPVERRAKLYYTASRTPTERLACLREQTCGQRLGTVEE
jgi:hypothetical protein